MPLESSMLHLDDAIEAYRQGLSSDKAAARYGLAPVFLRQVLAERGLTRDRTAVNELRGAATRATKAHIDLPMEEIAAAYLAGESENRIAQRYGVDRGTIKKRLLRAGVERRDIATAAALATSQLSPERRMEKTLAAHDAKRGVPNSLEMLCAAARARQANPANWISASERRLADWLDQRGVSTVPQMAIGPYNTDLAADAVAVEVHGGNFHATGDHSLRHAERSRYILDAGWHLVIVWDQVRDPLGVGAADYVAAFIQQTRRDPAGIRQYRVIRGCGEELARREADSDHLPLVVSQRRTPRSRA